MLVIWQETDDIRVWSNGSGDIEELVMPISSWPLRQFCPKILLVVSQKLDLEQQVIDLVDTAKERAIPGEIHQDYQALFQRVQLDLG